VGQKQATKPVVVRTGNLTKECTSFYSFGGLGKAMKFKTQPASGTACVATPVSLSGKYFKIHTGKIQRTKSTFNN